jgi:hypothetical protein
MVLAAYVCSTTTLQIYGGGGRMAKALGCGPSLCGFDSRPSPQFGDVDDANNGGRHDS